MHKAILLPALIVSLALPTSALADPASISERTVNGMPGVEIHCEAPALKEWMTRSPLILFKKDGQWQQFWPVYEGFAEHVDKELAQKLSSTLVSAYQGLDAHELAKRICLEREAGAVARNRDASDCAAPGTIWSGFLHKRCVRHAVIAQLDADYKKMIQILAMLRPAEAKSYLAEEILKLENQIAQAKATNSTSKVKSYEHRLDILRTEQQKLK